MSLFSELIPSRAANLARRNGASEDEAQIVVRVRKFVPIFAVVGELVHQATHDLDRRLHAGDGRVVIAFLVSAQPRFS